MSIDPNDKDAVMNALDKALAANERDAITKFVATSMIPHLAEYAVMGRHVCGENAPQKDANLYLSRRWGRAMMQWWASTFKAMGEGAPGIVDGTPLDAKDRVRLLLEAIMVGCAVADGREPITQLEFDRRFAAGEFDKLAAGVRVVMGGDTP